MGDSMITTAELAAKEQQAEKKGISKDLLMDRAGEEIAAIIHRGGWKKVLFVCYQGNNGGDGFCAARKLLDTCTVHILFVGQEEKLKAEAKKNYQELKRLERKTGKDIFISQPKEGTFDLVVDALLGTGSQKRELKEPLISAVNLINRGKFIISIDTPTGINPDTGEKAKLFVVPDLIITIHDIKPGLVPYQKLTTVIDIGL